MFDRVLTRVLALKLLKLLLKTVQIFHRILDLFHLRIFRSFPFRLDLLKFCVRTLRTLLDLLLRDVTHLLEFTSKTSSLIFEIRNTLLLLIVRILNTFQGLVDFNNTIVCLLDHLLIQILSIVKSSKLLARSL